MSKIFVMQFPLLCTVLTSNEANRGIVAAGFVKRIDCTYAQLVEILGPPTYKLGPDLKTSREWVIKIADQYVTVYDYKESKRYAGEQYGKNLKDIRNWHIGGSDETYARELAELITKKAHNLSFK